MAKRGRPPHDDVLTPREWEVLSLIRDGLSNDEIASRLSISLDGVKYHVSEILGKLGLENRHDAARWRPNDRRWALAPSSLWRRLDFGWLGNAVACALLLLGAGAIGVLMWGLMATRRDEAPSAVPDIPLPPQTVVLIENTADVDRMADMGTPASTHVVLRAIDPVTGADSQGREPVDLGHHALGALSPNGRTVALAMSATPSGPERIVLFDLGRWAMEKDTGISDAFGWLQWSPDGKRLHVQTRESTSFHLFTLNVENGETSEFSVPISPSATFLSPDGRTLYVLGDEPLWRTTPVSPLRPQTVVSPRLLAIDADTGDVRTNLYLDTVVLARLHEVSSDGYGIYDSSIITPVMSRDGAYYYILDAEDRLTVVDLSMMRVTRSEPLRGRLGNGRVDDGIIGAARHLAISGDGTRLYLTGFDMANDVTREWVGLGLQVIDIATLEARQVNVRDFGVVRVDRHGTYLYAFTGSEMSILDSAKFDEVGRRHAFAFSDALVGFDPAGSVTPPQ